MQCDVIPSDVYILDSVRGKDFLISFHRYRLQDIFIW